MRTKTKHKFSVWFLFAGASMLLVALWSLILPVINLIQGGSFYNDAVEWILGEFVAGLLALVDIGNLLLGIFAFVVLAAVLILFAFRRVRWLLVVPSVLLLWQSAVELVQYVIELLVINEYCIQWGMGSYLEYYGVLDWGDVIFGVLFPPIAYLCLTVVAVLYTIPKTRVVAKILGHTPAIFLTGTWAASIIIVGLGILSARYVSGFDLTPLPLVAGMWLLWVGMLRERQVTVPIYEPAPVAEPITAEEKNEEPVCVADTPAPEDETRTDISERDVAEAIGLYKKLLDSGAITEEEFNAKKAQLLKL